MKVKEIDLQIRVGFVSLQIEGKGIIIIMCEYKDMGVVYFVYGFCCGCYDEVNKYFICFYVFYFKRILVQDCCFFIFNFFIFVFDYGFIC